MPLPGGAEEEGEQRESEVEAKNILEFLRHYIFSSAPLDGGSFVMFLGLLLLSLSVVEWLGEIFKRAQPQHAGTV